MKKDIFRQNTTIISKKNTRTSMAVILRINLSNDGKDTKYRNSETKDKGLGLFRIKRKKIIELLYFDA